MNTIKSVKEVKVGINFGDGVTSVGRLAIRNRQIYFEYDRAAEIIETTRSSLAQWPALAKQYGVRDVNIKLIGEKTGHFLYFSL